MTLKNFYLLTTISSCLFGIAFLIMPEQMASWHETTNLDPFGKFVAQMLGGALFATGTLAWLSKNIQAKEAHKAILIFLLTSDFFYTTINAIKLFYDGGGAPLQWLELIVTTAFAIGAIYFLKKLTPNRSSIVS